MSSRAGSPRALTAVGLLGLWATIAHPQPLSLHIAAAFIFLVIAIWEWGSFHGGWLERWDNMRGPKG